MKLESISHVAFRVTNLAETRRFAEDFGLQTISNDGEHLYMRTVGGEPWCYRAEQGDERGFLGLGFTVSSKEDLERAVREHGASPVRDLDSPGGGIGVTLTSPEGMNVDLVWGVEPGEAGTPHPQLRHNAPGAYARHVQPQSSRPLQPATLFRFGHIGLYVKDFAKSFAWFTKVLGLTVSDTMHTGNPAQTIVGFLRIDRGATWVDHHTVFLAQSNKSDCHHISFEVQDYEAQFRAHRWLEKQGWKPNWGVGRHPLGSHVFDVWFDPDGYRFETFSDTDLVNCDHQPGHHDVHDQEMDAWSSDSPERYFA